jgi:hypothetical protein
MSALGISGARQRCPVAGWVCGVLAGPLVAALGGCFLLGSPGRPDPTAVSGPVPYVENCLACHAAPVGAQYVQSLHASMGIRCGQCHTPGGHPDFTQPIRDGKCGGCHLPEYQQTVTSRHFARRQQRPLDHDRLARVELRRDAFTATTADGPVFVGDSSSGELGGRLCAACHYDEHRLGRGAVQRANFCTGCHTDRDAHFPIPIPGNRCVQCHVRAGQTVEGQDVSTHRFTRPGGSS